MSLRNVSLAVAVVLVVGAGVAVADTLTIGASTDVWIRETDPDATYENDWISVGYSPGDGAGKRRYGLVEFNIGGVSQTIIGAHLDLYAMNYATNDEALSQQAGLLVPAGIGSTTWNNLWTTKTEILIEGLGYMDIPANSPRSTWYSSNEATADDLADLNSLRTGSGMVTMLLATGGSTRHEWGDAYAGFAPRLVITTIPEPSALLLCATGMISLLAYGWRRRK